MFDYKDNLLCLKWVKYLKNTKLICGFSIYIGFYLKADTDGYTHYRRCPALNKLSQMFAENIM
jgi:hypothetical protein